MDGDTSALAAECALRKTVLLPHCTLKVPPLRAVFPVALRVSCTRLHSTQTG